MGVQEDLNKFHDIDNLVSVKIELPEFEALRNAEPRGHDGYLESRYDWYKATSVTVSGSKYPKEPVTFSNVGVIKKSYWGSVSKTKTSMKLDFAKYDKSTGKAMEKIIGTVRITLNNCKQDPSYLRQPLNYEILRQAGVPYFRCNFAKVTVNNEELGLYVNMEAFREPYLKNNFDTSKGNAYEIDYGDDFDPKRLADGHSTFEGFSDYEHRKDITLVGDILAKEGLAGAKKVFNWPAFIKFWAMEVMLKHRDGYTCNRNNSFVYNDLKAPEHPTIKDCNFKFVISGVDLTHEEWPNYYYGTRSLLGKLAGEDEATVAELKAQLKNYTDTVFGSSNYSSSLEPYINRCLKQIEAAGVPIDDKINKQVNIIKTCLKAAGTELPVQAVARP